MDLPDLTTYLPLQEAADRYHVNPQTLHHAIRTGAVRAIKNSKCEVLVAGEDVGIMNIKPAVASDLQGKPIRAAVASAKYNISDVNLSRWAEAGYIRVLERGPKLLILDEAEVKRAVEIFQQARQETGSSVRAGHVLKRILSG
jgi:predicted site-specific integrase-resolvase